MADAQDDLDLGEEGKSKKKLIIIIAIVAVLVISSAAVAFLLLSGGDEEAAEGTEQVAEEPDEEALPEAVYHALDPEFVVNLPSGRPKMAQIGVQVATSSPSALEFLQKNDPMIRHHLLSLFSAQDGKSLLASEGREKLQADVLAKLDELAVKEGGLKTGKIDGVYFTSFVLQ